MNEYRIVGRNRKGLAEKIFRFSSTNHEAYRLLIQFQLCRDTLVREWVLELLGPGNEWLPTND